MKGGHRASILWGSVSISLLGSVVPALVGVLGTVVAARSHNHENVVALLVAWTVIGYLMLTDFGLTRTSSRLVAANEHSGEAVLAALWRVAAPLGIVLTLGVGVALFLVDGRIGSPGSGAIRLLCVVPILAALQFPLVGALEARGRFGALATQRTATAVFTYLLPALVIGRAPDGLALAVVSITAYRFVSLAVMWRGLGLDGRTVVRLFVAKGGERREVPVRGVVMWLAISSMVGPLLLYVDRMFLGTIAVSDEMFIFYVSLSEIMIKSYMVPAAVLSVCFPWLVVNIRSRASLVRQLFIRVIPTASTALLALTTIAVLLALPDEALIWAGLSGSDVTNGRLIAAVAISCTALNWVSQAYIALLQAADRQRQVAVAQLIVAGPYLVALASAQFVGGIVGLSVTWGTRIVILWICLVLLSRRRLTAGAAGRPTLLEKDQ